MHLVKLKQFDAHPRKIHPSWDYSSPGSILSTCGGARIRGHLQTWPSEKGAPSEGGPGSLPRELRKVRGEESPSLGAGECSEAMDTKLQARLSTTRVQTRARPLPRRPAPLGRLSRPSWPSAAPLQGVPTPRGVPRPPQLLAPALLAVCPAPARLPAPKAVCPAPHGAAPRPSWPSAPPLHGAEPRLLRGVWAPCRLAVHVGAVAGDSQDPNRPMAERSGRGGGTRGASALPSPDYYEQVAHLQQGLRDRYGLAGAGAGSRPAPGSMGAPPPTTVPLGRSPDQPCPPNSPRTEFTGDTAPTPWEVPRGNVPGCSQK